MKSSRHALQSELAAALDLTRNAISQRARLTVDLGASLPRVLAARGELGQAFVNLLMNAADAIPEGRAVEHEVRIVARAAAGRVMVEVTDTGVGIQPDRLPRIFEPYSDRGALSPGLGLSVCHGVVTAVGGTLDVVSTPGSGSTFRVTLPTAPPPAPTVTASVSPPRGRVLIIDDDPLVGRSMARLLQGLHEVTVLTSPAEAVARLSRVFLTGGAFTDRARQFLAGGRPFLEKPVEAQALRARVAELVKRSAG